MVILTDTKSTLYNIMRWMSSLEYVSLQVRDIRQPLSFVFIWEFYRQLYGIDNIVSVYIYIYIDIDLNLRDSREITILVRVCISEWRGIRFDYNLVLFIQDGHVSHDSQTVCHPRLLMCSKARKNCSFKSTDVRTLVFVCGVRLILGIVTIIFLV